MPVLYKTYKDTKTGGTGLYYGKAVQLTTIDLQGLADIIQRNCSMKRSDVTAVLIELVEVMTDQLQNSMTVKLDGFGTFKVGIRSKGADKEDDFTATSNIKSAHICFLPTGTRDASSNKISRTFVSGCKFQKYDSSSK